jgi:hypothetical protein
MFINFEKWKFINENRTAEADHIIAYLESIKTIEYGKYKSHSDPNKEINKIKDEAFQMLLSEETEYDMKEIMKEFATYVSPEDDEDGIWSKDFVESLDEDFDPENVYKQASFKDLKSNFSEDGYRMFLKHTRTVFNSDSYEIISTVEDCYSEDGYIDIWRAIAYKTEDLSKIKSKYDGVGVYWSWEEDTAESYHAEFIGYDIVLHGKATTESIDWKNTLYKNVYTLKFEKEILLKDNSSVMIVGFHDTKTDKYIKLDVPIVVNTGRS